MPSVQKVIGMIKETSCPVFNRPTDCPRTVETKDCGDCVAPEAYIITTCNANAVRDDSWDVRIDGVLIGTVNIDTDVAQADVFAPLSLAASSLAPNVYTGCTSVKSRFDTAAMDSLTAGSHTLTFTCVQLNGAGNAFTLTVMSIKNIGGVLTKVNENVLASISGTYIVGDVVTRSVVINVCG